MRCKWHIRLAETLTKALSQKTPSHITAPSFTCTPSPLRDGGEPEFTNKHQKPRQLNTSPGVAC
jgi:hypothetical protein